MLSSLRAGIARIIARMRFLRRDRIDEPDAEEQVEANGVIAIAKVSPRTRATVVGVVQSVTYRPSDESVGLSAVLADGSGSLSLIWLGRNDPPGVVPGAHLRVEGMITRTEGAVAVINPRYDLLVPQAIF